MTAKIIDGKAIADRLIASVAESVTEFPSPPGLAVVLVGDDPASRVYVANKAKRAAEVGFKSIERRLPAETTEATLLREITALNEDRSVHGILVQLPLPAQINSAVVLNAIDPAKDVDGFHVVNVGLLWTGGSAMVPCTPMGCMMLIREQLGDVTGARSVIIGRSNIVGTPLAHLLLAADTTVTIAHSKTRDLPDVCREADILVAAVGRPGMVRGDWIREGATVIDVGINRVPAPEKGDGKTKLVGDVQFDEACERAGAITPVPGGVGPMTIACLLANTAEACRRIAKCK